jgi:hypothetical protein
VSESNALADYILTNRKTKDTYGLRKASIPGYALSMQDESMNKGVRSNLRDTASSSHLNTNVLKAIAADDDEGEGIGDNGSMFGDED